MPNELKMYSTGATNHSSASMTEGFADWFGSLLQDRLRRQNNHKLLFSLVMLEQWLRTGPDRSVHTEALG